MEQKRRDAGAERHVVHDVSTVPMKSTLLFYTGGRNVWVCLRNQQKQQPVLHLPTPRGIAHVSWLIIGFGTAVWSLKIKYEKQEKPFLEEKSL